METDAARHDWNGMARATGGVLFAGSILFLLMRPDLGVEARDALLAVLGLVVTTLDGADERPDPERTPHWHEYDGAFRGMVG